MHSAVLCIMIYCNARYDVFDEEESYATINDNNDKEFKASEKRHSNVLEGSAGIGRWLCPML